MWMAPENRWTRGGGHKDEHFHSNHIGRNRTDVPYDQLPVNVTSVDLATHVTLTLLYL